MSANPVDEHQDLPPGVPKPPSKEDIDLVSKDQALITDEWAPAPSHPPEPGDKAADVATKS